MLITHDRPDDQLAYTVRAPLMLELRTGETVRIDEWSLDGFAFPGNPDLTPTEGTLSIPFQGVDIRFDVAFKPKDAPKGTGAHATRFLRFDGLTGRQRETLALFYRALLSGRMAATPEIITSLDTPVDLVPMHETDAEQAQATARTPPRALRVVRQALTYLVLAALVFSTLGSGIWTRLTTVPIQNARISAPFVPHLAGRDGHVDAMAVVPGATVRQGDVLVVLSNPDTARALAEVRSRIDALAPRIDAAKARLQRLTDARARVQTPPAPTLTHLRATHVPLAYLPQTEADAYRRALAQLDTARADHADEARRLAELERAVQRELDAHLETLRQLKRERGVLRDSEDAMNIRASVDGVVASVHVTEDQFIARGTEALVLEQNTPRRAVGWVPQEMSAALYPGMPVRARVNLGAETRSFDARIDTLTAGIDPDMPGTFGILLSVRLTGMSVADARARLAHGAPVEMRALRPTLLDRLGGT